MKDNYVLDITFGSHNDIFTFCPIKDNGEIITGLSILSTEPPGNLIGVFHSGGQEKCEEYCKANPKIINKFFKSKGE